jgi:DNA-directed RNA polymerase specialized sigma24 family protein
LRGLEHLNVCKEGRTDAEAGIISLGGTSAIEVRSDEDRRSQERLLVRLAQAGDLSAFERLYRENERKVYALCMRLASNAALAEELTQDVFVRAWRKLGSFRGASAFSSWLYPLTVNVALSERRSRLRRGRLPPRLRLARKRPRVGERHRARGGAGNDRTRFVRGLPDALLEVQPPPSLTDLLGMHVVSA